MDVHHDFHFDAAGDRLKLSKPQEARLGVVGKSVDLHRLCQVVVKLPLPQATLFQRATLLPRWIIFAPICCLTRMIGHRLCQQQRVLVEDAWQAWQPPDAGITLSSRRVACLLHPRQTYSIASPLRAMTIMGSHRRMARQEEMTSRSTKAFDLQRAALCRSLVAQANKAAYSNSESDVEGIALHPRRTRGDLRRDGRVVRGVKKSTARVPNDLN